VRLERSNPRPSVIKRLIKMIKKKKPRVVVEVVGGLGNQLFMYAAGAYLAEKSGAELVLDISKVGVGAVDHGKTILNFQLDCEISDDPRVITKRFWFIRRVSNKLASLSGRYRKLKDCLHRRYTANSLGYEPEFASLSQARKISGYFQSYVYPDFVKNVLRDTLVLKSPSDWFKEHERLIKEENPIVLHMRRGDYLAAKDDFGVLGVKYYEAGVAILSEDNQNRNIWIFTDSPELIRTEIATSMLFNASVVIPPKGTNPNESMILMSRASDIVIGNSTYSWWAAYLASEKANVIAPEKWFRTLEDPVLLLPEPWVKITSQWID